MSEDNGASEFLSEQSAGKFLSEHKGASARENKRENEIKIAALSWNTESVRFGEAVDKARSGPTWEWKDLGKACAFPFSIPQPLMSCKSPSFLPDIVKRIDQSRPHLFVVSLQESAKPGSYLLSHAIPGALFPQYHLITRERFMGMGLTTWTKRTFRGLRVALFIRSDWMYKLGKEVETSMEHYVCEGLDQLTHGKGGLALVCHLPPPYGNVAFINVHLPFKVNSLSQREKREAAVQKQADHLEAVHSKLVLTSGVSLSTIFLMGDLNFRINPFYEKDDPRQLLDSSHLVQMLSDVYNKGPTSVYQTRDELRRILQTRDWLSVYKEGVDERGPAFVPTCKLKKGRDPKLDFSQWSHFLDAFQISASRGTVRTPGWCDRILYDEKKNKCRCIFYDRWDLSGLSDHAAVFGEFLLEGKVTE